VSDAHGTPTATFAAAVLCGGRSSRMGTDKALLEIEGVALARRVADALAAAGASAVVAVGGDAPALRDRGLTVVPDEHPGEGPLGGVLTALHTAAPHASFVAVLACDLVAPDAQTIAAVVARAGVGDVDVAVPVFGERRHFHHAVWRRDAADAIAAQFAAGERAPRRVAAHLRVGEVKGLDARHLADADDPEAFRRATSR
jgi:molybdopterin-guanine dinucleotide biosynthesis protein A